MVIKLNPELEAALNESARQQGVAPDDLAISVLRERFLRAGPPFAPRDEWERALLELATNCGVSLPNSAFSSEWFWTTWDR
jgi:hypothetical protein